MKSSNLLEKMNSISTGDHMVLLYEDNGAIQNAGIIANYIISRVNNNEKCLVISGDLEMNTLIKNLEDSIDFQKIISSGQLSLLDKNDAYSKDGKFSPSKMISLLKELSERALQEGYSGLAITGEISWVLDYEDGFEKIMEYENMLNDEIFGLYPVTAICRYNLHRFTSSMIINIIEVHPIVIWKGEIHENPFYFELVDIDDLDIEKFKVASMLSAISEYTNIRSRFHDQLELAEKKYQKLQLNQLTNIIVTLTGLLEIHDKYTKNHSVNVAQISKRIAENMNLEEEDINQVYYAGLVHDIGKAIISNEIINKKGKLSEAEFEIIKKHPEDGYKALIKTKEIENIANIVFQHHERCDGTGYPSGIKGENIFLESKIIAIADAYDAMTSDRPYRKTLSKKDAINEIRKNAGTQFDLEIATVAIEKVLKIW